MLPPNDITRDLLPPFLFGADDIIGPEQPLDNGEIHSGPAAPPANLPSLHGDEKDHLPGPGDDPDATPIYTATLTLDPSGHHFVKVPPVPGAEPPSFASGVTAANSSPANTEVARSDAGDGGEATEQPTEDPTDVETDNDEGDSIYVSQIAVVDQDASIIVNGYLGKVVARMHIDQDLVMKQVVDIDLTLDGDGKFSLELDQDVRIDQNIEIDIKIWDEDGVLYIDMYLHDAVEVEQVTAIDLELSDGMADGMIDIDQDIDMKQKVDIDIDIEDDLEERYIIDLRIETSQVATVDQTADIDITLQNNGFDVDVIATQTAYVDQLTIIQADFTAV